MAPLDWNKDYKPAPYPKTQEEREASAKKYGIPIEEYEPYPDDGINGAGDYPKLPLISAEHKDPFYPWDNPELKRNFGETLHEDFDAITEDRLDLNRQFHRPLWQLVAQFFGVLGGLGVLTIIGEQFKMYRAAVPPQYPKQGTTHYTFEAC